MRLARPFNTIPRPAVCALTCHMVIPNAYTSAYVEMRSPRNTSGAQNAGVPPDLLVTEVASMLTILLRPKSPTWRAKQQDRMFAQSVHPKIATSAP